MDNEFAISVNKLSKCYHIYDNPGDRLKQFIAPKMWRLFGKTSPSYGREFWALHDISFNVKRGETVGILGSNGSGKSTLLQIICGTLTPTSGTVRTSGRIAALLELGSGFNPDFTGRENIYLNAAVLGLSQQEIAARFDAIVDFADIGDFIEQPVKNYSSGMVVRLAFAVQSQIDPDILIVDEALSVGDAKFQAKCFDRLRQLKDNGTSILLVTHSSEQVVSHCTAALLINKGVQIEIGEPKKVVNRYMDLLFGKSSNFDKGRLVLDTSSVTSTLATSSSYNALSTQEDIFESRTGYNPHEYRWGDRKASILDYRLVARGITYPTAISTGDQLDLSVSIRFHQSIFRPVFGVTIKTKEGITVYGANSETLDSCHLEHAGKENTTSVIHIKLSCDLAYGDYFVSLGLASKQGEEVIPHDRRYDAIHLQVRPNNSFFGLVDMKMQLDITNI